MADDDNGARLDRVACARARCALLTFSLFCAVTLQSQDGQDFKVEVKVAKMSETIKNLIEGQ